MPPNDGDLGSVSMKGKDGKPMYLDRKPSEIYFTSFDNDDEKKSGLKNRVKRDESMIDRQASTMNNQSQKPIAAKLDLKKTVSAEKIKMSEPQPAVTDTLECTLLDSFGAYNLDIPLWHYCLHIPSIGTKKRSLSNTYRFYSTQRNEKY